MSGFARRLQQAAVIIIPTVPDPPAEPNVTAGNASITVFWAAPASDGNSPITGYTVAVNPGNFSANTDSATFSATVSGLTNGVSYTAAVTATNAIGSAISASSNPVVPSASIPVFPTAATTGIAGVGLTPADLTASGSITISTNNTTIDHQDITGSIDIKPGVTGTIIKNSRITTSGGVYCINCKFSGTAGAVTIQDCEIISASTADTSACINISAGSSILRCDISGSKQSINGSMGNVTIQDNYMHDIVNVSGTAHCENIYIGSCPGGLQIIHNTLLNSLSQTANVFMKCDFGNITDVLVQDNLLAGGDYCIYGGNQGSAGVATDIRVLNNTFSRLIGAAPGTQPYPAYWANGGTFGQKVYMCNDAQSAYSGNVWGDDGSAA